MHLQPFPKQATAHCMPPAMKNAGKHFSFPPFSPSTQHGVASFSSKRNGRRAAMSGAASCTAEICSASESRPIVKAAASESGIDYSQRVCLQFSSQGGRANDRARPAERRGGSNQSRLLDTTCTHTVDFLLGTYSLSTTPSVNTHHKEDVASRQLPMPNVRQTASNAPPMPRCPFRSHGRIPPRPRLIIAARPR
jgi:hypothetical protein